MWPSGIVLCCLFQQGSMMGTAFYDGQGQPADSFSPASREHVGAPDHGRCVALLVAVSRRWRVGCLASLLSMACCPKLPCTHAAWHICASGSGHLLQGSPKSVGPSHWQQQHQHMQVTASTRPMVGQDPHSFLWCTWLAQVACTKRHQLTLHLSRSKGLRPGLKAGPAASCGTAAITRRLSSKRANSRSRNRSSIMHRIMRQCQGINGSIPQSRGSGPSHLTLRWL